MKKFNSIKTNISKLSSDNKVWLRLQQVANVDDVLDFDSASEFIDSLFDISPCNVNEEDNNNNTDEEISEIEPLPLQEYLEISKDLNYTMCGVYLTETKVYLNIHKSNDSSYTLIANGGKILKTTTKTTEINYTETIKNSKQFNTEFRFIETPKIKLFGINNNLQFSFSDGIITFSSEFSGSIQIIGTVIYDQVEINITNINDGCNCLCFYEKIVKEINLEVPVPEEKVEEDKEFDPYSLCDYSAYLEIPDNVDCYKLVHHITKCKCSETEVSRNTVEVSVNCDREYKCPGAETDCRKLIKSEVISDSYVDCGETTGDISSEYFYKEKCCDYPNFSLPRCAKTTAVYKGGKGIKGGVDKYKSLYGEKTRIVAVGPPNGICGTHTIEQKLTPKNCCEDVINTPLYFDASNLPDVIADNSSVLLSVNDGLSEITWRVSGQDAWLDQSHTTKKIISGRTARIFTGDTCGIITVTATDGCTTVQYKLRAETGYWQEIEYWQRSDGASNLSSTPAQGEGNILYAGGSGFKSEVVSGEYKVVEDIGTEQFGSHCHPAYGDCCPVAMNQAISSDLVPEFLGLWAFTGTMPEEYWKDSCLDPDMCNATIGDSGDNIPPCNRHCQNCYPGLSIVWTYSGPWYPTAAVLKVRRIYKWVC